MKFADIIKKNQSQLKKALMGELTRRGYRTRTKKGFLYAKGEIPVLLVAHLDTVHKKAVETICYSVDGNIVMSPEGIGGDDRAGVYIILELIKKFNCHVLFCEDEEIGGIGATLFTESGIEPDVNYIVEFDRRGNNDAVFYDCDNPDFTKFITSFGFIEQFGSFSDISFIAPALGIAAVNLSAGYYNAHTLHEHINMKDVKNIIKKASEIIASETPKFEYMEAIFRSRFGGHFYEEMYDFSKYYNKKENKPDMMPLMPLINGHYVVLTDGELCESEGDYLLAENGKVYEYLYDLDVAIEAECVAFTPQGTPAKFDTKKAESFEVVPIEYALACFEEYDIWENKDGDFGYLK